MAGVILAVISAIFISVLFVKKAFSPKVCAICVSIFLTWAALLFLYKAGRFNDGILIGLLMGQSISGIYYTLAKKVNRSMRIFTLPYFLTLTLMAYATITDITPQFSQLIFMLAVWVAAYTIFIYRNDPGKKALSDAVMNCCGDE